MGLFKGEDERERWVILFLDNILSLLQTEEYNSTLAQGLVLYVQNSLGEILKMSILTVDWLKCVWDIWKVAYKHKLYTLTQSWSHAMIMAMQKLDLNFSEFTSKRRLSENDNTKDTIYKIYTNLLQSYIESSFRIKDFDSAGEMINKLLWVYPNNSNCLFLKIKYELFSNHLDMQNRILSLLNELVELSDFHVGYIVILLYETQDLADIKGKEAIAEFMLNYLLLQDTHLEKLQEVIDKNNFSKEIGGVGNTSKSSLTFLSIFINLYHYWGDRNEVRTNSNSKYLWSVIPLVNNFIEKVLHSEDADSKKLLHTFALCEEAIWLLGYLWNEGYSLVEKNPNISIKYLRTAANLALLSVKLIDQNQEKQKEVSIMNDQQKEIEFLKKRFLYFYNASCAILTSCTLQFKQLKKSCENTDLYETVIQEIKNVIVPKIRQCIGLVQDNILSQQQLNKISFALEIRTQKWYKDLMQECKDIFKTSYLLLLDVNSFIKSDTIHQVVTDIIKGKEQFDGSEILMEVYSILNAYNMTEDSISVLQELIESLNTQLSKENDKQVCPKLFLAFERLIDLTSNFGGDLEISKSYMKNFTKLLEQYGVEIDCEDKFLYLISKAWNIGVDEYDNERDNSARDFFLIASSVLNISERIIENSINGTTRYDSSNSRLKAYINKWGNSIKKASNIFNCS